ncbi:MAG: hypothetical protein RI885_1126 [Actinomycetota bacterium]
MVTVVIPWRPQPSRLRAFDTVVEWYLRYVPDADIRTVDSRDEVFNLSQCRNLGVRGVDDPSEVVVVNDADTVPEPEALRSAISAAATSGLVHLPYTEYHWLGATGSEQLAAGVAAADCEYELVHGACSGVYVTTPATWWAHGGQDEGFRGWGFEDAAWFLAHGTMLGAPPARHPGSVFALHHVAEVRAGAHYDANADRMERYRAAAGDRAAMRALIAG